MWVHLQHSVVTTVHHLPQTNSKAAPSAQADNQRACIMRRKNDTKPHCSHTAAVSEEVISSGMHPPCNGLHPPRMQCCVNEPPFHPISPAPPPPPSSFDLTLVFPDLCGFGVNKSIAKRGWVTVSLPVHSACFHHGFCRFIFPHRYGADPPDLLPSYLLRRAYMCIRTVIIGFPHASMAATACLTVHEIMAGFVRSETD